MLNFFSYKNMSDIVSIETIKNRISRIVEEFGISQSHDSLKDLLKQLASQSNWLDRFKPADQNEELLYEITVERNSGIALYLVSDSSGIVSPPHIHHTWAIIAGIKGVELNRIYSITDHKNRKVKEVRSISIGPGDVVGLLADEVHSTEVVGHQSTYHLHLYGCDVKLLQVFSERVFSVEV
jgi:predicted metal-dependent enzyme (double-stranded beta helix superfamily)